MTTKRGTLIAAILGSAIVYLDSSVITVALPRIGRDLPPKLFGVLEAQSYVYNGYLLTLSALLILAGGLTDFYGRRRMFSIGVALFGVMFLSGALYLFLGPGGPYLLPLLALLVVLILGFGLGLLPQVLAGRAGVPEGEDGGTLAPSGWGRAVRVMQYDVLAALALLWLSDRVGFLGIASLAIGAANVMVLAAYAAMSWRERHALPIDRTMPQMYGLNCIPTLVKSKPAIRILVIAALCDTATTVAET